MPTFAFGWGWVFKMWLTVPHKNRMPNTEQVKDSLLNCRCKWSKLRFVEKRAFYLETVLRNSSHIADKKLAK